MLQRELYQRVSDDLRRFVVGSLIIGPPALMVADWLLSTPQTQDERQYDPWHDSFDGNMELRVTQRPAFVDGDEGHKEYLRYMCLNDSLLKELTHDAYTELFRTDIRPTLGTLFWNHYVRARDALSAKNKWKNVTPDALKLAFTTFAATLSPYFSQQEISDVFGVSMPNIPNVTDDLQWIRTYNQYVSGFLPVSDKKCDGGADTEYRCRGVDRVIHFAQHAFLTYMLIYAHRQGLREAEQIPRIAKFLSWLGGDVYDQTLIVDIGAQASWEALETKDDIKDTVKRIWEGLWKGTIDLSWWGQKVKTGLFDPLLAEDYNANTLGAFFALALSDPYAGEEDIERAARIIDDSYFYRIDDERGYIDPSLFFKVDGMHAHRYRIFQEGIKRLFTLTSAG